MAWTIDFDKKAKEEFYALDKSSQKQIDKFLLKLMESADPRGFGRALKGDLEPLWRYLVGDYKIICKIEDQILTILVIGIRDKRQTYKSRLKGG